MKRQTLKTEFIAAETQSSRLLVMLHGLGDSIDGFRWLPQALNLSWLNVLLVNAPDPYYGGYSWFDFAGDISPGVKRSRELIAALLDQQRQAGFPSEQTLLGGFSQGCLMSIETGLRYPRALAGIIGVSGYVANPEVLLAELSPVAFQQRLLVTHGYMDPILPFAMVRDQMAVLKAGGIRIQWHEFVKAHNIAGESEMQVIRAFIKDSYLGT